jgi:hypothetical protein
VNVLKIHLPERGKHCSGAKPELKPLSDSRLIYAGNILTEEDCYRECSGKDRAGR